MAIEKIYVDMAKRVGVQKAASIERQAKDDRTQMLITAGRFMIQADLMDKRRQKIKAFMANLGKDDRSNMAKHSAIKAIMGAA